MEKVTGRLENQAQQGQRREQGEKRQSERGTRGRNVTRAELTSSRWVVGFCFFLFLCSGSTPATREERRGEEMVVQTSADIWCSSVRPSLTERREQKVLQ